MTARTAGGPVLACALVLAASLASCSDSPGPPLSLEEYASWCSESSLLAVAGPRSRQGPGNRFLDLEEVAATVDALAEDYESITPPAEIAVFHNQTLEELRAAAAAIDELPSYEDASSAEERFELMDLERALEGALGDITEDLGEASATLALSPAVLGPLTASGCLPLLPPTGARYAPAGSAIAISWEPMPGWGGEPTSSSRGTARSRPDPAPTGPAPPATGTRPRTTRTWRTAMPRRPPRRRTSQSRPRPPRRIGERGSSPSVAWRRGPKPASR